MFDSLPETKSGGAVVRGRAFSTAVLAHMGVLFALVSASVLALVVPGADPPLPVRSSLLISMIGDPNAGGAPQARPEPIRAVRVSKPSEDFVQPTFPAPSLEPTPAPAPETENRPPDSEPADSDGPVSNGPGGTGSGPGPGPGNGPGNPGRPDGDPNGDPNGRSPVGSRDGKDEPILITTTVEPPVLILRVQPEYPEIARRAHIQGEVYLEGVIGADGRVESLRTLKAAHVFLEEAARKAVRQWLYRPATQHGRIVKVYLTIKVAFNLD